MAQYKVKDAGFLDGIMQFIIYTKIYILCAVLKLGD